ncbi:MAG TPA: metalloregulator ArsR/SmtB family transcription factor [Candidatus Saccharimonadales bacterium]
MVEYTALDSIFHSLSDPIRRDILRRLTGHELSVGQLVQQYDVSFAAISKHLKVLEAARLIRKRREGRKQMIALDEAALKEADQYLEQYRQMWHGRYDKLDALLKQGD